MAAAGVEPGAEADRHTLVRRVTFDLTGLPPTPAEVREFLADSRPDAYERLVDRLLASPRYGERWGRHWLDVARYADTDGYEADLDRKTAYRYRDFVIRALNEDMPFDRFVRSNSRATSTPRTTPGRSSPPGSAPRPPARRRPRRTPRRTRPRSATTSWTTCSPPPARPCSA